MGLFSRFSRSSDSARTSSSQPGSRDSLAMGAHGFLQPPFTERCVIRGNMSRLVQCPPHVDEGEWIASHLYDFYQLVDLVHGSVADDCGGCSLGESREWPPAYLPSAVGQQARAAEPVSMAGWCDLAGNWLRQQLEDPNRLPNRPGEPLPADFQTNLAMPAFALMWEILEHVYLAHWEACVELRQEAHLNAIAVHLVSFGMEHDLMQRVRPPFDLLLTTLLRHCSQPPPPSK